MKYNSVYLLIHNKYFIVFIRYLIHLHESYNDDEHLNSNHLYLIYPHQNLVEQPFELPTRFDYNFYTRIQWKL